MYMSSVCGNKHKTQSILPARPRCIYTAARCTYPSQRPAGTDAYCLRIGCIWPAEAMHISLAVLRDPLNGIAVLRNKLSGFQSFMLTFARFYGRLHAKITRLNTIRIYTQSIKNLYSHPPPKNTQLN